MEAALIFYFFPHTLKNMPITTRPNISQIRDEIQRLRSFVIGLAGKDPEGNYRPEFVREILRAARETPRYAFRNSKSFLKQLRHRR